MPGYIQTCYFIEESLITLSTIATTLLFSTKTDLIRNLEPSRPQVIRGGLLILYLYIQRELNKRENDDLPVTNHSKPRKRLQSF